MTGAEELEFGRRGQLVRRWLRKAVWLMLSLTAAGEVGHQLLDRFGHALAHHWFHVLFGGAAAVAFLGWVARDVRRSGWPRFSWRIDPQDPR
jgi:hypothetical protein